MSRDDYRQRDAGPGRRRSGAHAQRLGGVRADDPRGYGDGSGGYPQQRGQDAPYGESYGYGPAGDGPAGYEGGGYEGGGYPGSGYGEDRYGGGYARGGHAEGGYAQGGYAEGGYAEGGYAEGGYAEGGYPDGGGYAEGGGYAAPQGGYPGYGYPDGGYPDGGYPDGGGNGYAGAEYAGDGYDPDGYPPGPYPPGGPYPGGSGPHELSGPYRDGNPYAAAGDGYRGAAAASGAHEITGQFRAPGSYDDAGGYANPGQAGSGPAYGGQDAYGHDGFAGQDPYERGGYDGHDDSFGWRDSGPLGTVDDPGLTRRRSAGPDGLELDAADARNDGFFRGFGGDADDDAGRGRRGRGGRTVKGKGGGRAGLVALGIVVVVIAAIAGVGFHYYGLYKSRHASFAGNGFGTALIQVKNGDTFDSISAQLLKKGVIAAVDPWDAFVASKTGLQPGTYKIHQHMSPAAAFAALTGTKNLLNAKVTIPDGMRETDILALLAKQTKLPLSQFKAAAAETGKLGLPSWAKGSAEGFLYPDTYSFAPGEKPLAILQAMVKEFNSQIAPLNLARAAATVHYTPYQIITGASLLEGEVGPAYFGQVARVIDNRINSGTPLEFDSTVSYALKIHTDKLTTADEQTSSPYNTFLHTDLPPGPIDSPDIAAIRAFLHPPHGNWTFFVTVSKNGTTEFTDDPNQFAQFQALAKKNGVTS